MAYIGKAPLNGFHAKQSLTGDGSTTAFTLDFTVATETSILVSVGGVLQEPKVAYNLTIGGTKIDFTEAPSSTDTVYIQYLGSAIVQNVQDVNGSEFVLDLDGDTSLTADTDDEIDIRVGGSDRSTIKTTGFHNLDSIKFVAGTGDDMQMYHDGTNSYLTNSTGALKLATETSGIAVTIGHSTSEVTIADNATVTGNLTVTGTLTQTGTQTFDGGLDVDNFSLNGTTLALSSGDMLIDVAGDITLDADGADINFADAGTTFGTITNSSSDFVIFSAVSDKDILIKGNDGGSTITALTLDMSAAGEATFNDKIIATELDISGNMDIDGTSNLDAVDIDGAVQIDGATTFGVDDTGVDVKFFGATSGAYLLWDESADKLLTAGGTVIDIVKDKLLIGGTAVTTTAAELNFLDTAAANSVVNSKAVIYGSSGELAGTLSTAAQTNVTSLGTLTALTVDDVAVDGKVITMTGSSGDTFTTTVGTNGATTLTTVDAAAAAANITITADGTAELAGTTVTLNSSGGVTLDADNGTITFADAGSSLGTITSSGYSGTAAVATAVTVTDNESTNENNVLTFVAGADSDGGNVGLESDGNLTYNPSTGTLSATNLVVSGTQTITNSVTMNASNAVVFEGSTADAHETTLTTIDATGDRTISLPNVSGTLPVLAAVSATAITSTPEELNILDDATVTTAELNLIDGGTARGTTAIADGDGVLINDDGTMRQTNVTTLKTYMSDLTLTTAAQTNITSVGTLTALTVDNMAFNGNTLTTTSSDFIIDASHDIVLDADGADIVLKDAGTAWGQLINSSGLRIHANVSDSDITLTGNDGGSVITALTLDMSAAGKATFNDGIVATTGVFSGVVDADAGITVDNITIDGTEIDLSSGDLTIDVAGDIILDADGADIKLQDAGTQFGVLYNSSGHFMISSEGVSDKDIYFRGNDGGSVINALQLDMSAAGAATFNNDVTAFSDARLKDNVETIPNALETVCAMRGVNFTRNDNNDQPGTGVIAQEMQEVFPVVVKENNDENNTLSVSYGNLVGVLIESIKELKAEIDELKGN